MSQRQEPVPATVAEFLSDEYAWSRLGESLLAGIDPDAACTTLSGGQWMRTRLSRALDNGFLILDEPTNDLDRDGRVLLIQFLHAHAGGLLLISHDRDCIQVCDEIYELSNRGMAKFGGGWSDYVEAKDRERHRLTAALDLAKRERDAAAADRVEQRARQDKRNRRGADSAARGGTPKILLGARKRRAQTATGKLDATTRERSEKAVLEAYEALSEMKVDPVMYADLLGAELPAQKLIAESHRFNIRFRDWIYSRDLDFAWRGPVRVALRGANGSGKSTLLKALRGETLETRGQLRCGELATLYIDQQVRQLDETVTLFDNVRAHATATDSEIRTGLARFLFARESVFQKVGDMSGGERLRAALAQAFLANRKPEQQSPHSVLIEPINEFTIYLPPQVVK